MEFIVKNNQDFNVLRRYAIYSSSLTGVLDIPDNLIDNIIKEHEKVISKYINKEEVKSLDIKKPMLILVETNNKKKLYLDNADPITSLYLDLGYDKEIKRDSFEKAIELLKLDVIVASTDVSKLLSKNLTDDSKLTELFCSNYTTNYKHKRISLANIKENGTIDDLAFFDKDKREIVFSKLYVYQDITIKSIEPDNRIIGIDDAGVEYELRFFYLSENKKANLAPHTKINIMTGKAYGGRKKIIIDPEIVPANFPKTFIRSQIKTSKRDIPTKLLQVAWAEYSYRTRKD